MRNKLEKKKVLVLLTSSQAKKNVKVELALLEIKEIENLTWMDVKWMKSAGTLFHSVLTVPEI